MKIQNYILSHPDWENELTQAPYCLKIKRSAFANGRYVMFNYNQIETDPYNEIASEARGLVLDSKNDFKAVRRGFTRFFNYGEGPAAKIDWETADATIKEDGTLIFLSFYDGRWIYGTRQNFDLKDAEMSNAVYPTFNALLCAVVDGYYKHFTTAFLDTECTYCFELCTRHNRIVIDYPEPKFFLLAAFENDTGYERPRAEILETAEKIGVDVPRYYKMSSPEDYTELVEGFGMQHEGIVVRDGAGRRIKMKSKLYFEMHKSVSNGAMDLPAMVGLVRKGEQAEFLSYFPEYEHAFARVQVGVSMAYAGIHTIRDSAERCKNNGLSRKEFALRVKDSPLAMLHFKAWDGKLTDDFVESIPDDKFAQIFRIEAD